MGGHSPEHWALLACSCVRSCYTRVFPARRSHVLQVQTSFQRLMETAAWIAKEPHQGDTNPSRLPCVQFCVPWNLWYQPQGRARTGLCHVLQIRMVENGLEKNQKMPWKMEESTILRSCIRNWLVVSTPLKNISQLGWLFPIYGKIKNVPNHQPGKYGSVYSRWSTAVSLSPQFFRYPLAIQPGNGKTLLIDFFPLKDLIIFAPILNLKSWYLVKFVSMFNDTNVLARIKEFVEQGQENDLGYWRYKTAKCHHTQPSKGPFLENHSRPQERMSQSGDGLSQRSSK